MKSIDDLFDPIEDDETDEWFGSIEGEPYSSDEPVVCDWGCGDDEGLCVKDRYGCHQLGCVLVSEL